LFIFSGAYLLLNASSYDNEILHVHACRIAACRPCAGGWTAVAKTCIGTCWMCSTGDVCVIFWAFRGMITSATRTC